MRLSVFIMMTFSAIALTGAAWAKENPMGAGLVIPAGEAKSPLNEGDRIPVYKEPNAESDMVGMLTFNTGWKNPYQLHVLSTKKPDPEWKQNWIRRLLGLTAPIIRVEEPVSEFTLSRSQKGIMIVRVEGSWLQIAGGWFQWTRELASHAQFKAWSELYQEASFEAFQLSNARTGRADLVPLSEVTLLGPATTKPTASVTVAPPARFVVGEGSTPAALAVTVTGGTCKDSPRVAQEGAKGWVALFAETGAPQVILQPEECPEEEAK